MLRNLGNNKVEIEYSDGTIVLYSYHTAVAACLGDGSGFVRTAKQWSRTTSKHISQWLGGAHAREVSQDELNEIANRDEQKRVIRARQIERARRNPRNTKGHTIRGVAHQLRWVRGARGDGSHA